MEKKLLVYREDVDRFVELLARSKAVWLVPELQNLVAMASSPSAAYDMVLQKTGKRKKALAGRWLAVAIRDYEPMLVRSCIRRLDGNPHGCRPENLKQSLSTMLNCNAEERYREIQNEENTDHRRQTVGTSTW